MELSYLTCRVYAVLTQTLRCQPFRPAPVRDSKQGVYTHEEWGACPATRTNLRRAQHSVARGRDTKETKMFPDVRLAGMQESLPQHAEVTIGLLPSCLPGKRTQWPSGTGRPAPGVARMWEPVPT